MKTLDIRKVVLCGVLTALLAIMGPVSITIGPIPITLQTFAIALTGYVLGSFMGTTATIVYILLGIVGLPIFAGFKGGFGVIVGYTGGFIIGFPFMACLCGLWVKKKNAISSIGFGLMGLVIVHIIGILQYMMLSKGNFISSALLVSIPFLVKDIISVVIAYILGSQIRKRLIKGKII